VSSVHALDDLALREVFDLRLGKAQPVKTSSLCSPNSARRAERIALTIPAHRMPE